jgi:hypothetical protein
MVNLLFIELIESMAYRELIGQLIVTNQLENMAQMYIKLH